MSCYIVSGVGLYFYNLYHWLESGLLPTSCITLAVDNIIISQLEFEVFT